MVNSAVQKAVDDEYREDYPSPADAPLAALQSRVLREHRTLSFQPQRPNMERWGGAVALTTV